MKYRVLFQTGGSPEEVEVEVEAESEADAVEQVRAEFGATIYAEEIR